MLRRINFKKTIFLISVFCFLFTFNFSFAETFTISSCPAETDLYQHLNDQIDDRINGLTASTSTIDFFSSRGNGSSGWTRNSNVWTEQGTAIDLTGVSPYNSADSFYRRGTLITPKHIILANHYSVLNGTTFYFIADDGSIVSRTMTSSKRIGETDLKIGVLDSEVPSSITHYPILDLDTFKSYLKDGYNDSNTIPVLTTNQYDDAIIREIIVNELFDEDNLPEYVTNNHTLWHSAATGDREDFTGELVGGDSGNPMFVLIGGKPVLLIEHLSHIGAPFYSYYFDDINDTIDDLATGYDTSTIDLSCFNAPIVLSENITFTIYEGDSDGTIVGTTTTDYNEESDTPYYSIIDGNDDSALAISSSTGIVTVADADLTGTSTFPREISIKVEEDSPGGRASKQDYYVTFASAPRFSYYEYVYSIDENSATSTVLATITATDSEDDDIEYSIISGNDSGIFQMSSSTGAITIANRSLLDYETDSSHTLTIKAQEVDTDDLFYTTAVLTVNVNDTSYDFSSDLYEFEIDETDTVGGSVGSVSATINDLDYSEVYYQIVAGNSLGIFTINSSTGAITISDTTNLDGNDVYALTVGISNGEGETVLTSIPVSVDVTYSSRPTLSFEKTSYIVDEGSTLNITVNLSSSYEEVIKTSISQTLGDAVLDTDYSLGASTLTFEPGETSKVFIITANDDSDSEDSETALISMSDLLRASFGSSQNTNIIIRNSSFTNSFTSSGGGGGGSSKKDNDVEEIVSSENQLLLDQNQTTPTPSNSNSSARDLQKGDKGIDVKVLQIILNNIGYPVSNEGPGSINNETEYFGELTRQALIKFQQQNNVSPAVGYFGPLTKGALVLKILGLVQN